MSKMKTFMLAAFVVFVAASFAFAQDGRGARPGGGGGDPGQRQGGGMTVQMVDNILNQLNLTDEQKQKTEQLKADYQKKLQAAADKAKADQAEIQKYKEANPADAEGLRKKQDDLAKQGGQREAMLAFIEQIKGVLNEEQLKKFNQLVGGGGGQGMGQRGPQAGGGMPMAQLGLGPQAMDDLKLTDEQKDKAKGLMQKYTDEQRQLVEKYQGLVKEMLTPEQQTQYVKLIEDARNRPERPAGGGAGGQGQRRMGGDRPANPPDQPNNAPAPAAPPTPAPQN